MTAPTVQLTNQVGDYGSDIEIESVATLSDYGSDIDIDDDILLASAFATIRGAAPLDRNAVLPSVEFEQGEIEDEEQDVEGFVHIHKPPVLRVAQGTKSALANEQRNPQSSPIRDRCTLEVEYDERSRRAWSVISSLRTTSLVSTLTISLAS